MAPVPGLKKRAQTSAAPATSLGGAPSGERPGPDTKVLHRALGLMIVARTLSDLYDEQREVCSRYVHSTSRGHEAIQLAAALQLTEADLAYPYYRDDSILLGLGMKPREIAAQLLAKADDPFSGGRTYYCHPSLRREGMTLIPHQSSATGMQAIPATGAAHGLAYRAQVGLDPAPTEGAPGRVVLCSIGDGAMTEGEVAEALQMAVLHRLPIVYLVQDNEWAISATRAETRAMTAYEYAAGFKGLERMACDGADFIDSYETMARAYAHARSGQGPVLVHATCPLLGHHTSGVRREWYRTPEDIEQHLTGDPLPRLRQALAERGDRTPEIVLERLRAWTRDQLSQAMAGPDPDPATVLDHVLAPVPAQARSERGIRTPAGSPRTFMVDAALHALEEILTAHPEALFYGQDVGPQLGGVFREASGLSGKFGTHRVFNTPIQEAYIIGSTAGMSAVGLKPIVEIQFADYFWPGMNQFVTELSKSTYLSRGQFPVGALIRVPIGAYGGGGPYHSGSIESALLTIKGVKICYPSNAADLKGLMKAAYHDPNPVVMLEHKGLYWSKSPGTEEARTPEPDADYLIPLGQARVELACSQEAIDQGRSCGVITYGMGVHWAREAARQQGLTGHVEVLDLRTLAPYDEAACRELIARHGKVLILTEEPASSSFAQALAGHLSEQCFRQLDGPIRVLGALTVPAIPLNRALEAAVLPNADKVATALRSLLDD